MASDVQQDASPADIQQDETTESKKQFNAANIDDLCISLAKANFAGSSRLGNAANKEYMKSVQVRILTNIVIHAADEGKLEEAEHYMGKLDARADLQPEIRAVNALIRNYMAVGNDDAAEEWFRKAINPALYPEMGHILPDHGTFYYFIQTMAQKGSIAKAEYYFQRMDEFELLPTLPIYRFLIIGCVRAGPPHARRGVRWCEQLLARGCLECPGPMTAEVVKAERHYQEMTCNSHWSLFRFDELIKDFVKGLADSGYTLSANKWLGFLVETGFNPKSAPETWEHVRAAHPKEIIPTLLSGETESLSDDAPGPHRGAPALAVPARLSGEEVKESRPRPDKKTPRSRAANESNALPLHSAVAASPRIKMLSDAIADGEAVGLPELELRKYKAALSVEEREAGARMLVQQAVSEISTMDMAKLAEALSAGEAAGLGEEELKPLRESLERADLQAKARARLEEAMRKRETVESLPKIAPSERGTLPEMRATWATGWRPRHQTGGDAPRRRLWSEQRSTRHYLKNAQKREEFKKNSRILYL